MVVTFYSYKGGVGRSMALANIARWMQSCGLDIVVVDWDLEAPGIESFFLQRSAAAATAADTLGLMDLLVQYRQLHANLPFDEQTADAPAQRASDLEILRRHLPPLDHALVDIGGGPGRLRLLPAGWRGGERFTRYANAVQAFDWNAFYAEAHGHAYFDWLRQSLCAPGAADVVLIDSRTGVTEMGGVCTRQMADVVVVLSAPNRQNLEGAVRMADSFRRPEVMAERDGRPIELVMVPSRVDVASSDVKIAFERDFAQQTRRFLPAEFERLRRDFWDLRIPYVSKYAFVEELAVGEPDGDPDLQAAYRLIAAHLAWLAPEAGRVRSLMRSELDRVFGGDETRVLVAPGRLLARALDAIGAERLPLARRILLRMVTVSALDESERPTPRLAAVDEFDSQHAAVLEFLVLHGVVKRAPNAGALFGLAQDEIVVGPEMTGWIDEDRDFLLWRQRLRTYLEDWEAAGRQASALLRGSVLEQAVRWMDERPSADLWPDERAFVDASLEEATRVSPPAGRVAGPAAAPAVFICYRRRDTQAEAVALARHLRREAGSDVFLDIDIAPGEDFRQSIAERMKRSTLVLVLIGPDWAVGGPRSVDFVEAEIAHALQGNKRVIPVLIRGAQMPREEQLSAELAPLARRQALVLDLDYNAEAQLAAVAGLARQASNDAPMVAGSSLIGSIVRSLLARMLALLRS